MRAPEDIRSAVRRLSVIVLVESALGLGMLLLGAGERWAGVVLLLLAAPAFAVFMVLPALDLLARVLLAGTAAIVVNGAVAQFMVTAAVWSISGGIAAVGTISVALALAGCLRANPAPAVQPAAEPGAAA